MAHWLMKSEPDVFGWPDLVKKGREEWHSVRNYTARNNMKAMKLGDEAFFYHSNIGKEIVGIMKVIALAHPDSTAEPNDKGKIVWECVDVAPVKPLKTPVTLEQVKTVPGLEEHRPHQIQPPLGPARHRQGMVHHLQARRPLELAVGGSSPAQRGAGDRRSRWRGRPHPAARAPFPPHPPRRILPPGNPRGNS